MSTRTPWRSPGASGSGRNYWIRVRLSDARLAQVSCGTSDRRTAVAIARVVTELEEQAAAYPGVCSRHPRRRSDILRVNLAAPGIQEPMRRSRMADLQRWIESRLVVPQTGDAR